MRRDQFVKSLCGLVLAGGLAPAARAAANLKVMIPANPGGGWDTTGRALGKALQDSGQAATVTFDNKGGAAGALGLAQFLNAAKGDPNALMVMGAVMIGGLITSKSPLKLEKATPIADLYKTPDAFVGKTIRLDGVVTAVCQEMGCWMALAAENNPDEVVRFKVDHGVGITFPISAKGKKASAEGTFERIAANDAEAKEAAAEHGAHGKAADFGAKYQIKATGAVIR